VDEVGEDFEGVDEAGMLRLRWALPSICGCEVDDGAAAAEGEEVAGFGEGGEVEAAGGDEEDLAGGDDVSQAT
jgi:hypothetical protein